MFEKIVLELLNKFLGSYFEDIDTSHLNLSVWKGDVVLSNVYVKRTATDNLYLPFQVVAGKVGTLTMKFPWKNLYTAPVELTLKDLHIVARPSQTVPYNQEEEERQEFLNKMKKVEEIEEARRAARVAQQTNQPGTSTADSALQSSTFKERLMLHIVRNVQIRIEGIHIRYEDTISNPKVPFSFGVVLSSLHVQTTDTAWTPVYITDQTHTPTFYKLVAVNGLAFYLNPDAKLIATNGVSRDKILIALGQLIKSGKGLSHMIGPISTEIKLNITPSPETTTQPPFALPKVLIQVAIKQLTLGISNAQFQDIFRLAETTEFMARARIWRKYRPDVRTYKENYKSWWKFAYACVLVEIRRRRDSWNYSNIKKHIQLCKEYADSYTKKFVLHKNRTEVEEHLQACERSLDLFSILLVRQQIEVKKERIDKLETEMKKKHGWISHLFGWNAAEAASEIAAKFGEAWTPAESLKLTEAMGYTEKAAPTNCPEGYVLYQLEFKLKVLDMIISEFVKGRLGGEQLLQLKIEDVVNKTQFRPVRNGLTLEWIVGNLQADTFPSPDGLVTQVVKGINVGRGEHFLEFKYERHPLLLPKVNGKISCVAKPLEFIYHTRTVQQLVQCFKVPSEIQLRRLRSNAASRIKEWKETGSENLKRLVQTKTEGEFLLDINVSAPYFIIPQNGELDENSNVLIVDLGQLLVRTGARGNPVPGSSNADIYTFVLRNVQVLVALPGKDNRTPSGRPSPHVLHNPKVIQSIQVLGPIQVPVPGTSSTVDDQSDVGDSTDVYNPARRSQTLAEVLNETTMTLVLTKDKKNSVVIDIDISDIFVRLSAGTVELLERISKSWNASTEAAAQVARQAIDRSNMWLPKMNTSAEFPFLNTTEILVNLSTSLDNIEIGTDQASTQQSNQCLNLRPTSAIVTFEVGVDASTKPLLFFESKFEAEVLDWSEHIRVNGKVSLAAAYINTNQGMWEYLLEPVEAGRYGSAMHRPWELHFEVTKARTALKDSSQMSLMAGPANAVTREDIDFHRVFVVKLFSNDILELTLTRTAVEIMSKLSDSFKGVSKAPVSQRQVSRSPYVLVNATGSDLTLMLQHGPFLFVAADKISHSGDFVVPSGTRVNLELDVSTRYSVLREQEGRVERHLRISIPDYKFNKLIQVNRAEGKFYQLPTTLKGSRSNLANGIVCDVRVKDCSVVVTIRGIVNVANHLTIPVDIFCADSITKKNKFFGRVDANHKWHAPISILATYPDGFFFAPAGFNQAPAPFSWISQLENPPIQTYMICAPNPGSQRLFHMLVSAEVQQIMFENTNRQTIASRSCSIHIRPPLVITNLLPTALSVYAKGKEELNLSVEKGSSVQVTFLERLEDADFDIMLKLPSYAGMVWTSNIILKKSAEELTCWEFTSNTGNTMHLGVHKDIQDDTVMLYIYCQFWMINLTGLNLSYKQGVDPNEPVFSHPSTQNEPVMFSVGCKYFLVAKTARLKCGESDWSDVFYLDVAGSSAIVKCISGPAKTEHQICATTKLVDGTFTKTVTFKPRFYVINQCPFQVTLSDVVEGDERLTVTVNSKMCVPFWPRSKFEQLKVAVYRTDEFSIVFPYGRTHNTVLKFKNRYGAINVHVLVTSNRTTITIDEYRDGQAPVLLMNNTKNLPIAFYELEIPTPSKGTLMPNTNQLFTWSFPMGKRTLVWSIDDKSRSETGQPDIMDQLLTDGSGTFAVKSSKAQITTYYWISFLHRFQRILLFTDSLKLFKRFENAKDREVTQVELSFSLFGVGFSLVDIVKCREVLYARISSVGVAWETTRNPSSNRYRQIDPEISDAVELTYIKYLQEIAAAPLSAAVYKMANDYEVNFAEMVVLKPDRWHLRRCPLQPGVWLYFKKFAHCTQFHIKVTRFQVDNQLPYCTYPTILNQVFPPKSVTTGDGLHKPFVNLSLIRTTTPESQSIQFIFCSILIQEFNFLADMALSNSVMSVFDLTTRHRERVEQMSEEFLKTYEMLRGRSEKYFSRKLQSQGKPLHIENLQLSPIKLHLSYSVTPSRDDARSIGQLFLKSIGVTIGTAQDVVFKLAGLELKHMCLTTEQLIHEVKTHYISQATKQLYAYFFGLDVIGNPISYLSGVTEGIETFFYEPVQGAILGPEEFAEGLSLGLKSLVGHAVGGTADAVAKITGVLGTGIALLSLDEEYQRRRRTVMGSKLTLGECTKTLLKTGIVDTVVGVVSNPIKGAYSGGLPGFGFGLVKGTLGLVARPIGAVIDFATGTLSVVKRVTKPSEALLQTRPPRFMERNRGIEPYVRQVAEGALIFKELNAQLGLPAGEQYVAHIVTATNNVFLITETRAFYLKVTDMFGKSSVEWEHPFDDFTGPPTIQETERGLSFTLQGTKKRSLLGYSKTLLGRDNAVKVFVPITDAEICMWILTKLTDTLETYERNKLPDSTQQSVLPAK